MAKKIHFFENGENEVANAFEIERATLFSMVARILSAEAALFLRG